MSGRERADHSIARILSGARWATVLRVLAQIVSWGSTLVVVRYLSPEDYGLNAMLEAPLVLLMGLSTFGLEAALVQAKKVDGDSLRSTFGFLVLIDGVLFLAYFFGGTFIAAYFDEPLLDPLAKTLAFLFLFIPFRVVPNSLLDRQLEFKLRAQVELACSVAAALTTLALAYSGAGVWALVLGVVTSRALQTIILTVVRPWFVWPSFSFRHAWEMVSIGTIVTVASSITVLSDQLATLIGGPLLGPEMLGVFALGAQLAAMPLAKGMPILNQTLLPAFAKFRCDQTAASYYFHRLLGVVSLVIFPVLLGLAVVADTLVATVFGSRWVEASMPLAAMSAAMILRFSSLLLRTTVLAMGRADLTAYVSVIQLAATFPLTMIGAHFGIAGLVTAFVASEAVTAVCTVSLARPVLEVSLARVLRAYRPALVASLGMAAAVILLKHQLGDVETWATLVAEVLVGAMVFVAIVRFLFIESFRVATSVLLGR